MLCYVMLWLWQRFSDVEKKMKNKIKQKKDWGDHAAMSSNPINTEWEWRPHGNGSVTCIENRKKLRTNKQKRE